MEIKLFDNKNNLIYSDAGKNAGIENVGFDSK